MMPERANTAKNMEWCAGCGACVHLGLAGAPDTPGKGFWAPRPQPSSSLEAENICPVLHPRFDNAAFPDVAALPLDFEAEAGVADWARENGALFYSDGFETVVEDSPLLNLNRVAEGLAAGRKVAFMGRPCRIAGLKAAIDPEHHGALITIDTVCRGVTSVEVGEKCQNLRCLLPEISRKMANSVWT